MKDALQQDKDVPVMAAPAEPTPVMRQYMALKAKNPDAILFFRMGDFYELFHDDARKAAPLLEVVLTQRQGIPMCGIPYHALAGYMAKLLKLGVRIAIAEQMEDPATAKGMVHRDVVRVVTPGTVIEDELLQAKQNNFLLAIAPASLRKSGNGQLMGWGLAALDMSTGEFLLTSIAHDADGRRLADEIARLDPREIILARSIQLPFPSLRNITPLEDVLFNPDTAFRNLTRALDVKTLDGFGLNGEHPALPAAGAILQYVERNQPAALGVIKPPRLYHLDEFLALDDNAIRHLDLFPPSDRPVRDALPRSLWEVLDNTVTPMGGRKLKWWLLHPLRRADHIRQRQTSVEFFVENGTVRKDLAALLKNVSDVERILGRLTTGGATGRDLNALRKTLHQVPELQKIFAAQSFFPDENHPLKALLSQMNIPAALTELLDKSLSDDPPLKLTEGGLIRDGYSAALDELRDLAKNGRAWISKLEAEERQRTGIGSLKIGYTSVFGYYLEVSRTNIGKVPPEWIRKQTLANAERFITPDLKAYEDKIVGAEEKSKALEAELFTGVRAEVHKFRKELRDLAEALSEMDAFYSLAEAADRGGYVRPKITDESILFLEKARHPVVEKAMSLSSKTPFVPNDALLDGWDNQILLITGPNMAGKSTYLRQIALLVIMAQIGSFVPAEEAKIGIVDRIFTRIGAGDNLAAGASTFLVEMQEVSSILHNATPKSLVILDEVGRGTSTYDGVAVAWSVVEYLHRPQGKMGPKVLFATHYFELTDLPEKLSGVKNFHATAREWARPDGKTELVFLHQILSGPADRSYGVHVAQMAGLPAACVQRAKDILAGLEKTSRDKSAKGGKPAAGGDGEKETPGQQLDLFKTHPVLEELKKIDPNSLTPLEALQILYHCTKELRGK